MPEFHFGDIVSEPSDNSGHTSTWVYLCRSRNYPEGLCLDDDDPQDKSLIGNVHMLTRELTLIACDHD